MEEDCRVNHANVRRQVESTDFSNSLVCHLQSTRYLDYAVMWSQSSSIMQQTHNVNVWRPLGHQCPRQPFGGGGAGGVGACARGPHYHCDCTPSVHSEVGWWDCGARTWMGCCGKRHPSGDPSLSRSLFLYLYIFYFSRQIMDKSGFFLVEGNTYCVFL